MKKTQLPREIPVETIRRAWDNSLGDVILRELLDQAANRKSDTFPSLLLTETQKRHLAEAMRRIPRSEPEVTF